MLRTVGALVVGFLGGTAVMTYRLTKRQHGSTLPPPWLDTYTAGRRWSESLMYETYLGYRSVTSTFFENQVVENIKGFNFFKIYTVHDDPNRLICIFNANESLCFHQKILHGGATSLLLDSLFGYATVHSSKHVVATANINVNYWKPLYCHKLYAVEVYLTKREGRKMWVEGKIYPIVQGEEEKEPKPSVQASALMVQVNWSKEIQTVLKRLFTDEKEKQ